MIPVIDWKASDHATLADEIGTACRDPGFFVLKRPDVDPD